MTVVQSRLFILAVLCWACQAFLRVHPSPRSGLAPSLLKKPLAIKAYSHVMKAKKIMDDDDEEDFIAQELDRRLEELDEDARGSNQIFKPAQVFTVPSTKAYSKESGADYVVDPSLQKKKKKKPASPDQFPRERMKAEIVSPYKNNWILFVMITVFSLVFFGFLFPELLNKNLNLQIPDFEAPAPTPFNLRQ